MSTVQTGRSKQRRDMEAARARAMHRDASGQPHTQHNGHAHAPTLETTPTPGTHLHQILDVKNLGEEQLQEAGKAANLPSACSQAVPM